MLNNRELIQNIAILTYACRSTSSLSGNFINVFVTTPPSGDPIKLELGQINYSDIRNYETSGNKQE